MGCSAGDTVLGPATHADLLQKVMLKLSIKAIIFLIESHSSSLSRISRTLLMPLALNKSQ